MARYNGTKLTNKGKALLLRAINGEKIIFSKVQIGNGILGDEESIEDLEGLKQPFKNVNIIKSDILENGAYRVRCLFNNSGIDSDKELREIGLFAIGRDNIEVLYSYANTDDPDIIPGEEYGTISRTEDILTYISNAMSITAFIDESIVYATVSDLDDTASNFNSIINESVNSLTLEIDNKENKFIKNSGFNLDKSDNYSLDNSNILATCKALKEGLEYYKSSSNNIGAVSYFATVAAPTGWLKADGAAVSRTVYSSLFAAIGTLYGSGDGSTTFNIPDLRGEFIRGFDDGRGIDSGRTFGSSQSDELKSHRHTGNVSSGGYSVEHHQYNSRYPIQNWSQNTGYTGGNETRPRNIALLACIKY